MGTLCLIISSPPSSPPHVSYLRCIICYIHYLITASVSAGSNGAQDVQYAEASNVTLQNGVLHQWADQEGERTVSCGV